MSDTRITCPACQATYDEEASHCPRCLTRVPELPLYLAQIYRQQVALITQRLHVAAEDFARYAKPAASGSALSGCPRYTYAAEEAYRHLMWDFANLSATSLISAAGAVDAAEAAEIEPEIQTPGQVWVIVSTFDRPGHEDIIEAVLSQEPENPDALTGYYAAQHRRSGNGYTGTNVFPLPLDATIPGGSDAQ